MLTNNSYMVGLPNNDGMSSFNSAIKAVKSVWTSDMDESIEYYVSKAKVGAPVVLCRGGIRVATLMTLGSTTSVNPQSSMNIPKGVLNGGG